MKPYMIIKCPSSIDGCVKLPASKSISNRALVINSIAGRTHGMTDDCSLQNVSDCDDTNVMFAWLDSKPETVDIGAAGTAMRFSSALLAVTDGTHVITGTERMKNRPIGILVNVLRQLGAEVEYVEKEGFPPLRIKGSTELAGGEIYLSGNVSSQYISALLMIAPVLKKGLKLYLTDNVVSRPYIDMTLAMMRDYGAEARIMEPEQTDDNAEHPVKLIIEVEPKTYSQRSYFVESDWSASSYWYEMVLLSSVEGARVELPYLFEKSMQGDSKVAKIFDELGVKTEFVNKNGVPAAIITNVGCKTDRLDYDFLEQPDLAQTFVVACCMMNVKFHFKGLQSLKIKETDRIEALKAEMRKLGYVIADKNNSELIWDGERCECDMESGIDTYEDHRMAMAFAPAALKIGSLKINNPQVVSKSYPKYWDDLMSVGFECSVLG